MNRTIAFLDSCVLFPFSLRDVLIQFCVEGMYQAKWSSLVRVEVIRNVEAKNPSSKGKLVRTFQLMERAIPDFSAEPSVETRASVKESATDAKDIDILVAAIDGECTHLVTSNLRHFDIAFASARGVAIIHPDKFLTSRIGKFPLLAKAGFEAVIARYRNPSRSKEEYCETFKANYLPKTSAALANL